MLARALAWSPILVVLWMTAAGATPQTYEFMARVVQVRGPLELATIAGDSIEGSFVYDADAPVIAPGVSREAVRRFEFTLGSDEFVYDLSTAPAPLVWTSTRSFGGDILEFRVPGVASPNVPTGQLDGAPVFWSFAMELRDLQGTVLPPDGGLPDVIPDGAFESRALRLDVYRNPNDDFATLFTSLDSLVLVPEPGTGSLVALGLIGLTRHRQRVRGQGRPT